MNALLQSISMFRAYVQKLQPGRIELDADESHHLASVLRAAVGDVVEVFDDAGAVASATVEQMNRKLVALNVEQLTLPSADQAMISVFSAVPKGERADWMIEKLSEVGCDRLTWLQTARSVVVPKGQNKFSRWRRIAIESAKQCRRIGVMTIFPDLVDLKTLSDPGNALSKSAAASLKNGHPQAIRMVASLRPHARPLIDLDLSRASMLEIFIGPEGDFSDDEYNALVESRAVEVSLTPTVMRVETAAMVACSTISQMVRNRSSV